MVLEIETVRMGVEGRRKTKASGRAIGGRVRKRYLRGMPRLLGFWCLTS